MLHCKIAIPPYQNKNIDNNKDKFDVNWELGGWRHQWNWFCWRMRRGYYFR